MPTGLLLIARWMLEEFDEEGNKNGETAQAQKRNGDVGGNLVEAHF